MGRVFSARLDEGAIDELNRSVEALGITKKQFLEEAIRLRARALGDAEAVWEETLGAWKRREKPQTTITAGRRAMRRAFQRRNRRGARLHR